MLSKNGWPWQEQPADIKREGFCYFEEMGSQSRICVDCLDRDHGGCYRCPAKRQPVNP